MKRNSKMPTMKEYVKTNKSCKRSYCLHARSSSRLATRRQTVTSKDPVFPGEKRDEFKINGEM